MRAFRSVCRRQMELVIRIPHRARIIIGYMKVDGWGFNMGNIRMRPYPPSFNKIAASTIEPAIGAST